MLLTFFVICVTDDQLKFHVKMRSAISLVVTPVTNVITNGLVVGMKRNTKFLNKQLNKGKLLQS